MSYMDVYVAAVPTAKKQAYLDHARLMDKLFKQAGALEIVETWGNDGADGELTSFPMAVKCEPGETVAVGWIKWPSKDARDAAWGQLMQRPEMQSGANPMPFDGNRMIFGGFDVILEV